MRFKMYESLKILGDKKVQPKKFDFPKILLG